MRRREINKGLVLTVYCVAMFFVFLITISTILNHGNTDMTAEMAGATFPVVSFSYAGMDLNCLHGYAQEMDVSLLREEITPLMEGRKLSVKIDTYGTEVATIAYEVRSIDGERLIEDTQVYNYVQDGNMLSADIALKDLMEPYTEYSFCLKLVTAKGNEIRYYTRIVEAYDYEVEEKLEYVYYFSNTTFDKPRATNELPMYLESNSQGDNSTFHYVNIHSSLDQVTWGNLPVSRVTPPMARILEMDEETAHVEVNYFVSMPGEAGEVFCDVTEYFRIRVGTERIYLLDYERTMDQVFDMETAVLAGNKIMLGITDTDIALAESSDGNRVAFSNAGKLYSYNCTDNKMAVIFEFYGQDVTDLRHSYKNHEIKIFSIDETGNVYFMVYGYMNRGIHEGEMGIAVYYYDSVLNMVEEQVFVPYDGSFEILKENMEELSYVNGANAFYFYLNNALYEVALTEGVCREIVTDIAAESFIASETSEVAVWAVGDDINAASSLYYYDLVSGNKGIIAAAEDEYIKPIGFFGNDLIYGLAKKADLTEDAGSNVVFPMYRIVIRGERGAVLKTYEEEGIYVSGTVMGDGMVSLQRIRFTDGLGEYEPIGDDQILNNREESNGRNYTETVVTQTYETIVQIVLKKEINTETLQILTPKQVIFEGERRVELEYPENLYEYYYVYVKGHLEEMCFGESRAVSLAYEGNGVAVNGDGRYIYRKEMRPARNQIMAIEGIAIEEGEDLAQTRAACLEQILLFEGIHEDLEQEIRLGMEAEEIMAEHLPDAEILDLTGCSLEAMLYYAERDIPVYAQLSDGSAVLLIGYNEFNVVTMNPLGNASGELVFKIGMNDATELFEESGNRFYTYIRHGD